MSTFQVPGISCGACAAKIEKSLGGIEGVDGVAVDVATKEVTVAGSAEPQVLREALSELGYPAAG